MKDMIISFLLTLPVATGEVCPYGLFVPVNVSFVAFIGEITHSI
jgi:hypothetical protein